MAVRERMVRSSAVPQGRENEVQASSRRPELRVVKGGRTAEGEKQQGWNRFLEWTRGRTAMVVCSLVAVAFLVVSLFCSLLLRVQMEQDSFDQAQSSQHISALTQDVQDDQATLDALQSSLPQKAQEMGMVPQQGSVSIDLQGYQPPEETR
ncbi:hypothetical protein BBOMB_0620 [Bifidobacterium bombi DSM 19703]|uniref:Uncharacterized protein n=2 Tax=Bifidobacterium bombi TaxID=471511 RepID=A0A080N656_9BIFI|nr:hypothetical protein BBOMB_0620 [Bifidobacterium bombi DSM 19703]